MKDIDFIKRQHSERPQLSHASNIIVKFDSTLSNSDRNKLNSIIKEYAKYLNGINAIDGTENTAVIKKVRCLNQYYNFIHDNGLDNLFSSQGKFRPTILEEFLFLLFENIVKTMKQKYDSNNVLDSGSIKAYTNIFFKAKDFKNFIQTPEIGINEKDQDFAIYRSFDISINKEPAKRIRIPAVAIEAKTYVDKTMLDGIIATAEKLKSGNPYTRFVAVAERYDVSTSVDPSYSRIDQIYILRKGIKKGEWNDICEDVVLRLYNETINHLMKPWSDIKKRLNEDGVIIS